MYGPTPGQIATDRARNEIREFLLPNRGLGREVLHASVLVMSRYDTPDPTSLVLGAIQQHDRRDALCSAILGPWGQVALAAIGWEFPEWRPVFGVLSTAAQVYCEERDKANARAAIWTVAILGIAGVIAAALSGGRVKGGV